LACHSTTSSSFWRWADTIFSSGGLLSTISFIATAPL